MRRRGSKKHAEIMRKSEFVTMKGDHKNWPNNKLTTMCIPAQLPPVAHATD